MPSLRETKNRIKSVQNTEKITRAMKMVAASKLRKAQEAVLKPRSYTKKLADLIGLLCSFDSEEGESKHPLLRSNSQKKRIEILILSSDRGLCGSLNSSVIRAVQNFITENSSKYDEIMFSCIGKKGFEALSRMGLKIRKYYEPSNKIFNFLESKAIAREFCERFLEGQIDGAFLIYNEFKSAMTQTISVEQMLPVMPVESGEDSLTDFIYEPQQDELLNLLIPKHFASRIYHAYLESYASEQGARMTAMDSATRNAKEMTQKLTLQYNRVRQAAITKELMEIIGGAEAL